MGLFNGLIAILAIKILFLRVNIWHVSAITFDDDRSTTSLFKLIKVKQVKRDDSIETFNNSNCSELISRNISQVVPYTEIFRYDNSRISLLEYMLEQPFLRVRTRVRYKTEFYTIWTCCEGYVQHGSICVPRCPQSCVKGTCKEPDVCTCNKGYRMSPNTNLSIDDCVPECTNGCINGTCVEPEVCLCNDGYFMDLDKSCRPLRNAECERKNGHCSKPNVCPGYKQINDGSSFTCEPICNEGYILVKRINNDTKVTICEPICENGCFNGKCIKPGLCSCNPGFVYDETNQTCKPHCDISCGPYGECTSPNNCTCFKGYHSTIWLKYFPSLAMNPGVCQPKCEFNCFNGKCTAPNTCTCLPGFYPSWIESPEHPDNDGHTVHFYKKKTYRRRRTEPPCNTLSCGNNASCHKTGVCICDKGYSKDTNGICVPFYPFECPNGMCTAPQLWHDGFALRNDRFCDPICERGCQNGDCIGPNECVCHNGFIPNTDHHSSPECIPMCIHNCSGHGECIIDHGHYKCECHFGWTRTFNDRDCKSNMCVIMMAYDHDDVNRITIRNDTNSTIIQALKNLPHCDKCDNDTLDNETLCYMMDSDEGNISNISCLIEKFACDIGNNFQLYKLYNSREPDIEYPKERELLFLRQRDEVLREPYYSALPTYVTYFTHGKDNMEKIPPNMLTNLTNNLTNLTDPNITVIVWLLSLTILLISILIIIGLTYIMYRICKTKKLAIKYSAQRKTERNINLQLSTQSESHIYEPSSSVVEPPP